MYARVGIPPSKDDVAQEAERAKGQVRRNPARLLPGGLFHRATHGTDMYM